MGSNCEKGGFSGDWPEIWNRSRYSQDYPNRDIIEEKDIAEYLNGSLSDIPSWKLLKDIDQAADLISEKSAPMPESGLSEIMI